MKGIRLHGARIHDRLDLTGLQGLGPVVLQQCVFDDVVDVSYAGVDSLDLDGSWLRSKLVAEGLKAGNGVDLRDDGSHHFVADDVVFLVGAKIGLFLEMDGARLNKANAPSDPVLFADTMEVSQSVHFRAGFVAEGGIRMRGAKIAHELQFHGGIVRNPGGVALDAVGIEVNGSLLLDRDDRLQQNFVAAGRLLLTRAQIKGDVVLNNAQFEQSSSVDLDGATVGGRLAWTECHESGEPNPFSLILTGATVGAIADSPTCWPAQGRLFLDGLHYGRFAAGPTDAQSRLAWIRRQPSLFPQPYEQLARVLTDGGDPEGAKMVRSSLERDRRAGGNPIPSP